MVIGMIDFDNIDDWEPELTTALSLYVPNFVRQKLAAVAPHYVEDAQDLLFDLTVRDEIIDATLAWIRSTKIAGYHGSRLADVEVASIRASGLIPLQAEARRHRLVRALSMHPEWNKVVNKLDSAIQSHGQGNSAGHREGQVHLTLSKESLTKSFNHYLTHGSEFDQHVAYALLGNDGKNLLALDGNPTVIQVAVPGSLALDATHRHFDIDYMRTRGEIPNLVNEFLKAWSFRLAHPEFQSRTLKIDCGMMFRSTVPVGWLVAFDTLAE